MLYTVLWKFGSGASESQSFDDLDVAQVEAASRALAYAQAYGRCETTIHDQDGQQHLIRVDDNDA